LPSEQLSKVEEANLTVKDLQQCLQSLGLPARPVTKQVLAERLAREAELRPYLVKWEAQLQARDSVLLECILNCWVHLLLPTLEYDFAQSCLKDRRRAWTVPTNYDRMQTSGFPFLFMFRDTQELEGTFLPRCAYFTYLECMRMEYEYHRPHLTAIGACPEDVYQFSRLVRVISGPDANQALSRQHLLRVNCPRELEMVNLQEWKGDSLAFLNRRALERATKTLASSSKDANRMLVERSKAAFHPVWAYGRPLGITVYDFMNGALACKMVKSVGPCEQFSGCQVTEWKGHSVRIRLDFDYADDHTATTSLGLDSSWLSARLPSRPHRT